ncbi:hypothetical protein PRK78_006570 [Emydomyces testavorans]|uniref:Uncharacterized protein n=1 Tax=Emydomyces testavorans TaxID=2070801 RepID=A0AAF0DLL8_9EURO|nr:hypothetical protein PRK78_006570 [Emydomyces testavorans]
MRHKIHARFLKFHAWSELQAQQPSNLLFGKLPNAATEVGTRTVTETVETVDQGYYSTATTDSEESDVKSEPKEARVKAIVNEALLNKPDNHGIGNTPQPRIPNKQSQTLKDFPTLIDNESTEVPHHQSEGQTLSQFATAFGLWCEQSGISRQQYTALREVLNSVEDINTLKALPNGLSDLKKKCQSQFPILPIRSTSISVVPRQLPTLSAVNRESLKALSQLDMFFQDPVALLEVLAQSPAFHHKIHIDMAELVDEPTELWQSFSWGSSIRCTSGDFAQYPNRDPIFPSNIVHHTCQTTNCKCHRSPGALHYERVQFVAQDQRPASCEPGSIILRVRPMFGYNPLTNKTVFKNMVPPFHARELIEWEDEDQKLLLDENNIVCWVDIYLNYKFNRLSAAERRKRNSLYTISLGPHATNYPDVIGALTPAFQTLDEGFDVPVTHEGTIRVVAPCIAFLGDMPQQNDNAEIKRPSAVHSCQICNVAEPQRHNMSFDTVAEGQYHYQLLNTQSEILLIRTAAAREKEWKASGMNKENSPILQMSPCINLVTFFPSDPAHSELSRISKMMHTLLVTHILTANEQKEYCQNLQQFPFPQHWGQLQSPLTHLESYQLQEHARASITIPIILQYTMKQDWIHPVIEQSLQNSFGDTSNSLDISCTLLAKAFSAVARSNSTLVSQTPVHPDELHQVVLEGRTMLQKVINAVVMAAELTKSKSQAVLILRSQQPSVSSHMSFREDPNKQVAGAAPKAGKELRAWKNQPNMHIGIHYMDQAKEYALPNNCNMLAGEDKHHEFKNLVQRTNKQDVEKKTFKHTLSLVLEGAFVGSEPSISERVKLIHNQCPTLINSLLRTDSRKEETEDTGEEDLIHDHTKFHIAPSTSCQLQAEKGLYAVSIPTTHPNRLPANHNFMTELQRAYRSRLYTHTILSKDNLYIPR